MQALASDILLERYAQRGERSIDDIRRRVATALSLAEQPHAQAHWEAQFYQAQCDGFIPAGRINASAGTGRQATMINCFVLPMDDALVTAQAALTMRLGGGVGYDFSALAPIDAAMWQAIDASGDPVSTIGMLDKLAEAMGDAQPRLGAQMAVLHCQHPDVAPFIHAKDSGGCTHFNNSVACTDAFMQAVLNDQAWDLLHPSRPTDALIAQGARQRSDGQWVYRTVQARVLFDAMSRTAHDHGEPGLLFIDAVSRDNNLSYCEAITATNPCAEQPLPAYGACDLGSINLCRFVLQPFTDAARFDFQHFKAVVAVAVRMLDNVLDLTTWPLPQQKEQALAKRRIGLGFTGLGDALVMLGLPYGDEQARRFAAEMARTMRDAAYAASVALARDKGAFPLFDKQYLAAPRFASRLPANLQEAICEHGIRNSHLLSIAPTGTISLAFADNVSSGIEPAFSWSYRRKRRMPDGSWREYRVEDHAWNVFRSLHGLDDSVEPLPWKPDMAHDLNMQPGDVHEDQGRRYALLGKAFVSAMALSAHDHLAMCAAVQPYVDAGVSKTINLPVHAGIDEVRDLFLAAWRDGLKGITVYRDNAVLGAVLSLNRAGACAFHDRPEGVEC